MAELRDSLLRALAAEMDANRGLALVMAGEPWTCCPDARDKGPAACTCWRPVFDREQADPDLQAVVGLALGEMEPPQRPLMCGDCAYRPGSPERTGSAEYNGSAAELDRIAREDRFWCHDGMRKPVAWRHPRGMRIATVQAADGDFQPPIIEGVPYRADGQPGLLCAGWAARRRALTAECGTHRTASKTSGGGS